MPHCEIKICGITREQDVELVCGAGADYVGLLIDMPSPRTLTVERAAELARLSTLPVVLLFFDKPPEQVAGIAAELRPHGIQLQGHESPEDTAFLRERLECEIWKGVHLPVQGTGQVDVGQVEQRIKAYAQAGADKILLDTVVKSSGETQMGGTGKTFDWQTAAELVPRAPRPVILAGGLKPENVAQAIKTVRPHGVDLSSGVESAPGIKDPDKVRRFIQAVRQAQELSCD